MIVVEHTDRNSRMAFWDEYFEAQLYERQMAEFDHE